MAACSRARLEAVVRVNVSMNRHSSVVIALDVIRWIVS
jgi:hypothetical protein